MKTKDQTTSGAYTINCTQCDKAVSRCIHAVQLGY